MSFRNIFKGKSVNECEKDLEQMHNRIEARQTPPSPPIETNWVHQHGDYILKYVCHCGDANPSVHYGFGGSLCPKCGCVSERKEEIGRYEWECNLNHKWKRWEIPSMVREWREDIRNFRWVKKPDGACGKVTE